MSVDYRREERRSTARIEVDSMLLYRAVGMDNFKFCVVLTASIQALEIVSERSIPVKTEVAMTVRTAESLKQYYRVYGTVTKREQRQGEWMHIVMASPKRPWPSKFLFDVMCSTRESSYDEVAGKVTYRKEIYAELESLEANLDVWEARMHFDHTLGQGNKTKPIDQKEVPKVLEALVSHHTEPLGEAPRVASFSKFEAFGCSQLLAYGLWQISIALKNYTRSGSIRSSTISPKK